MGTARFGLVGMSNCDVICSSVNHLTAREEAREEGGLGRSEARGENRHHSLLHFHFLQAGQEPEAEMQAQEPWGPSAGGGWLGDQQAVSPQPQGLLYTPFQLHGCCSSLKLK